MMFEPQSVQRRYEVRHSAVVSEGIRYFHQCAAQAGSVKAFRAAYRHIVERLEVDPDEVGEPRYRLPALRMRVCCVVVRPLVMDFAISEDSRIVFIRRVQML